MKIVNVPIEPVRGRYSEDWGKWFEAAFAKYQYIKDVDYITIAGPALRTEIKDGAFLDVIATNHYKANQIQKICAAVDSGVIPRYGRVVFLIHDGWFPIEQLAYMRDMLKCHDWRFVGLFHAGTYDPWDQTAQNKMYTWGEDYENSLFKIFDKIIIASYFHRDLLLSTRRVSPSKLHVIPWKVEVPDRYRVDWYSKKNQIVFPHRHNPEKQPDLFYAMQSLPIGWEKIATSKVCHSKEDYYQVLFESKIAVSFSLQETFGIAMVEAVLLGCLPLVPNRLSYSEMYPTCFKYNDMDQFAKKMTVLMADGENYVAASLQLRGLFRSNSAEFFDDLFRVVETI